MEETEDARRADVHGARVEIPGRVKCKQLEQERPDIFWARQFSNRDNLADHRELGKEILKQTDCKVDAFIAAIGTGGNFLGVAQVLKEEIDNVRCVAVEPAQWPGWVDPLSPEAKLVPGITGGIIEEIRASGFVDEIAYVGNDDAKDMAYRLSRMEGVFCGMSTGANVYVSVKEAKNLGRGCNVVTCAVDRGDRYFSDERFIT